MSSTQRLLTAFAVLARGRILHLFSSLTRPTVIADLRPFRIAVAEDVLVDLQTRLRNTRWPGAELVDDWSQGVPLAWVQDMCRYWAEHYDWRRRETALNRFDQFITAINGLDVHFIHARSPEAGAMPLLITHGWPGSVVEFHKVIEPLTDPTRFGGSAADAFHVVCPSLPGFGFSGKPKTTGWGVQRIAQAWMALMARLGYTRYGAQGGDWGSLVTRRLGQVHPEHCRAIHVNMLFTVGTPRLTQGPLIWLKWVTLIGPALLYDKREIPALKTFQKFRELETGYQAHILFHGF